MECQIPVDSRHFGGQSSDQTPFAGSLNHTQMVLFDGTDGKLGVAVSTNKRVHWGKYYDFRGIHSSSHNFQPHFRVLLNNL